MSSERSAFLRIAPGARPWWTKTNNMIALLCFQRRHPCFTTTVGSPEDESCFPTIPKCHVSVSGWQKQREREARNSSSENQWKSHEIFVSGGSRWIEYYAFKTRAYQRVLDYGNWAEEAKVISCWRWTLWWKFKFCFSLSCKSVYATAGKDDVADVVERLLPRISISQAPNILWSKSTSSKCAPWAPKNSLKLFSSWIWLLCLTREQKLIPWLRKWPTNTYLSWYRWIPVGRHIHLRTGKSIIHSFEILVQWVSRVKKYYFITWERPLYFQCFSP